MQQEPNILIRKVDDRPVVAVAGLHLEHLLAPSAFGKESQKKRTSQEELPAGLVRTLAQLAPEGVLSLRYLFDPACPGQIDVFLLARVSHNSESTAQQQAKKLLQDLFIYLDVHYKLQRFQMLAKSELQRACSPFTPTEVVEITRQQARLLIASWIVEYQRPIGFGASTWASDAPSSNKVRGQAFNYVLPFLPTEDNFQNLCETLLLQTEPYLIEIAIRPYILPPQGRNALEEYIQTCEGYLQQNVQPTSPTTTMVLHQRAQLLRDWFFQQKHTLEAEGNAFLMRILIAAQGSVSPGVIAALGTAITRATQASLEEKPYLAGGFQWRALDPTMTARLITDLEVEPSESENPLLRLFDSASAEAVFRFPFAASETFPGLRVEKSRILEAPEGLPNEGTLLGTAKRRGQTVPVRLKTDDHRRHVYAVGQTGVGKSTLLLTMIMDHIRRGEGVGVIDPHGDLIRLVLERIPNERLDDVIFFDPGDVDYPVGLNLLEWKLEEERAFLVDELVAMLRLLYPIEIIGPMFEHNVRHGLLLLMANQKDPGTLVQLPQLFVDPGFHKRWLPHVSDPLVQRFWEKEFPITNYRNENFLQYIITKFDPFITHPLMRNIIGQPHSSLDFEQIINNGKIFLVDLAKGKLGDLNAKLLGMIVIAKLYSAAMRRIKIPRGQRRDFFVYVDEFQNLATETFSTILSEARKFRLNLTVCNQYIAQLPSHIISAILGNVGTLVLFRVGVQDAGLLEEYMPTIGRAGLSDQRTGHAYVRLLADGILTPPFSLYTQHEPERQDGEIVRQQIIEQTRKSYGRPRDEVEREIAESLTTQQEEAW